MAKRRFSSTVNENKQQDETHNDGDGDVEEGMRRLPRLSGKPLTSVVFEVGV